MNLEEKYTFFHFFSSNHRCAGAPRRAVPEMRHVGPPRASPVPVIGHFSIQMFMYILYNTYSNSYAKFKKSYLNDDDKFAIRKMLYK